MVSFFCNWTALSIHFALTWAMFPFYLNCLAHCIKFDSWNECTKEPKIYLECSAFYGLSGYLWVLGNYQDFHILYLWLIVTAQLIGLTFAFVAYAQKFVGYYCGKEELFWLGFLVLSFLLVLTHLLVAKDIIKNRWIKGFIVGCISLSGKVGFR